MRLSRIVTVLPARRTILPFALAAAVLVAGCGAGDDAAEAGSSAQDPAAVDGESTSGTAPPPAESAASAGSATDAVEEFYEASKALDQARVVEVVCAADRARFASGETDPSELVASYTVGPASEVRAGLVVVQTSFSTVQAPEPQDVPVPVVREDGTWRVCFSAGAS